MPCRALLLLAVAGIALVGSAAAQPDGRVTYADVRLHVPDPAGLRTVLASAGVALDHADWEEAPGGRALRTVLAASEVEALRRAGAAVEVLVPDLAAAVEGRSGGCPTTPYPVTGTMGCYPTFDQVVAILDQMRTAYPALVAPRVSLGSSHEGRDVWMVELSDNPGVDEGEPEALYTALHHAREPQGMATVLHFMWDLLARYGTDPEATHLLRNRRLFFVPVLNPDGYVHNETTNPGGGGMWRKNRRDNGDGSFGVDLNRNYGFNWGLDDEGSSPFPGSGTYRGPSAFSEPETSALRDFLNGREVRLALNYHTFGDLLIFPWGYTQAYTPDDATFRRFAREMTRTSGYVSGIGPDILYGTNGNSDDWMYGEQATKPKIYAYTPEVGSGTDGFWPLPERILPIAQENLRQNLLTAWVAGGYPHVARASYRERVFPPDSGNGFIDPGDRFAVDPVVTNGGLETVEDVFVVVRSTSPHLVLEEPTIDPHWFDLAPGDTTVAVWVGWFRVAPDAPLGLAHGLVADFFVVDPVGGGYEHVATHPLPPVRIGTPTAVLADAAASLANWTASGGWGLSSSHPASPPTAFADSPTGNYPAGALARLTLAQPLDLSGAEAATLRFHTRWNIEEGFDFGQVLVSTNGTTWTPLAGRWTTAGSGEVAQPDGEPGYDGVQATWVEEEMDLSPYAGQPTVHLRFRLRSDGSTQRDGWFVDDVVVETLADGGTVAGEPGPAGDALALHAPAPNPARGEVTLAFTLAAPSDARLVVYDALGREVAVLAEGPRGAGPHAVRWDGRGARATAAPGVYLVRLEAAGRTLTRRVTLLR